jgi:hypothetical protein
MIYFIDIPGLGSSEWYLPATNGISLKIVMEYERSLVKIEDQDICPAWAAAQSDPYRALVPYLRQFHTLNTRWQNCYEPMTENIITQCAAIQEEIIMKRRSSRKPLFEEHLLIASALRALALAHHIFELCINVPTVSYPGMFLQPEKLDTGNQNPAIEVSRYDPGSDNASRPNDGGTLSYLIQDIVRITQGLLLKGRPTDLPTVFCTLCLLKLVEGNFVEFIGYIDAFSRCYKQFGGVWRTLAELLELAIKGNHPLVEDWDGRAYKSLVGVSNVSVAHFQSMNQLWIDGGMW